MPLCVSQRYFNTQSEIAELREAALYQARCRAQHRRLIVEQQMFTYGSRMFKGSSSPPFLCERFWNSTLFMRDAALLEMIENTCFVFCFLFLRVAPRSGPSRNRVESVRSCLRAFKHDFFFSCQVLHVHFFASRNCFSDHLPSYRSGRAHKEFVAGCGLDTLRCVTVRFVMFWVNIISDGLHFFCVAADCLDIFSLLGLVTVARQGDPINLIVCVLTFILLLLIGVVLASILVTTLLSRRYSMLRVWSDPKIHFVDPQKQKTHFFR